MLTIASPNTDRSLLTTAELRVAIGLSESDNSKDATLIPLGDYVSAMITSACKIVRSGIIPPTLRLETVSETFLFKSLQKSLVLARRPVVEITSVTQTDSLLDTTDYALDAAAGILYRANIAGYNYTLPNGPCGWWPCGNTVVVYSAGYATVPADLKYAAIKFVQDENTTGSRDPLLKRLSIVGVSDREFWVEPNKTNAIPSSVMDILVRGGYVNMVTA